MNIIKLTGLAWGVGLCLLGAPSAYAAVQTAVINGITVSDYGQVDPATSPIVVQPGTTSTGSYNGDSWYGETEVGSPGMLNGNAGWDPYGPSDATHPWWNVYSGSATFSFAPANTLYFIWGSPNYDDPNSANTLSFYSGDALVGTVLAADLYSSFSGIDNGDHAGYLLSFMTSTPFNQVVASNPASASDFEFAFTTGVPELTTWMMMMAGFGGLAFLGWKRQRQSIALSL